MCGSGTTIDVAKELNRRVIGYDLNITRPDIIYNDARKIPLENDSVDFVFVDSPYSNNIKYSDNPLCVLGKFLVKLSNFLKNYRK